MSTTVFPSSDELNHITFDPFLETVLESASSTDHIVIDLTKLKFIDLFAMAGLIYSCSDLIEIHDCEVSLEISMSDACSFLPRAGFFDVLPSEVAYSAPFDLAGWVDRLRGNNAALLELTPINSEKAIADILTLLIDVLVDQLHYEKNNALDLAIVFSELCHNVLDHNSRPSDGLAAMHVYTGRYGRFMQFVVADRGNGIRQTLRRNPRYRYIDTDTEAIVTSIQRGTSGIDDIHRGQGLFQLLKLASKHNGSVRMRSGKGKVYLRFDDGKERKFNVAFLSGSQFSITFPAQP